MREQNVESFYAKLRQTALSSSSSPVLIFPSTSDVDSLCALKIIFHILESDSIQYACYPVSSFHEIHKYTNSSSNDEPLSVVLVNWGNHRDLSNTLNLPSNARVFVVDSHRPIHLCNLSDQNDVVVVLFTKEDEGQSDLSYDFDLTTLANAATTVNSDFDSESEFESDSNSGSERLSDERYHDGVMELEQHINSSGNLDMVTSVTLKDGTKIRAPNSLRITYENQPRLMLLQEWSLFDSMMCSSYIATKLKMWSENRIKKLKLLFGTMGFALGDC